MHFDRFSLRDLYEQSGSQCDLPDMGKLWIWWKLQIPRGKEPPTVSALSSNHGMDMHGYCSSFCCYNILLKLYNIYIYITGFWFLLHTFWHLCSLVPIASNTGFRTCKSPGYPVDSNENLWPDDITQQLRMGPMSQLMQMIPGMSNLMPAGGGVDTRLVGGFSNFQIAWFYWNWGYSWKLWVARV